MTSEARALREGLHRIQLGARGGGRAPLQVFGGHEAFALALYGGGVQLFMCSYASFSPKN